MIKEYLKTKLHFLSMVFRHADKHISKVSPDAPWVYVSYIPYVYNHLDDEEYMCGHQNRKETVAMVDAFNELGYNVYLHDFTIDAKLPNINPEIVIGLEPNFNRACRKWPHAKKIYFATGAYYKHANKQIVTMTDYINKEYGGHIPYRRMTKDHDACELADVIMQIGSSYTAATYPEHLADKIMIIDQSSQGRVIENKEYASENEYFFMGSGGNILKGVSLLLEYFSKHPQLKLNIVGPIEEDFKQAMHSLITPNITLHGFVNMKSDKMYEIASKCNFMVYPSGTEGGCPGAVINGMKMGLVPIVTPWAAFDGMEDCGFIMDDWTTAALAKGIDWSLSLPIDKVEKMSDEARTICTKKFNLDRFKALFKQEIVDIMKG